MPGAPQALSIVIDQVLENRMDIHREHYTQQPGYHLHRERKQVMS